MQILMVMVTWRNTIMVMVNIEYPEKGCSTPCKAMRCQKCVLHDSTSVFEYLAKDREKDKPDWCPIVSCMPDIKEDNK